MTAPRPGAESRPKEVEASFWLWIVTLGLGLLGSLLSYQQVKAELSRQARATNPAIDSSTIESATTAGIVLGLLFIVVEIVFVFLMRGGRNWARIVMAVL